MKIALLGTKGIPNNYGGFEQFAEYLSVRLAARGHDITVYNPSFHPYTQAEFSGVRIKKIYSPEKLIGGAANFIYDHLCLAHALHQGYDIIYEAGYHSVAFSFKILKVKSYQRPVVITNMDGLEWRRSKWSPWVQKLIRRLEAIAVQESPFLISDNEGIRQYYLDEFKRDSFFVPYGADPVYKFDPAALEKYQVMPDSYFMLMARMEPENNIELMLEAYAQADQQIPFLVIGDYGNGFGRRMYEKYSSRVRFAGAVYDKKELDSMRHFSKGYCHGHSVGGTNPSLLEAMACQCLVLSHQNQFNRSVLGDDAVYFSDADELVQCFKTIDKHCQQDGARFKKANLEKIVQHYSWDEITRRHENLFVDLLKRRGQGKDN